MTRQEVIVLMKDVGHSTAKAVEIAIDYERGYPHAVEWVKTVQDNPKWKRTQAV